MINSIIKWAETVNWNEYAEWAISHAYILYYLPFPIIILGAYYMFKSVYIPSFWLRASLSILVTLGFGYYHKSHITVPQGNMDFELIGAVSKEYIAGSVMCILALVIFMIRSIVTFIKGMIDKKKVSTSLKSIV